MILRPSSFPWGDKTVSAAGTGRYKVGVRGKISDERGSDEGGDFSWNLGGISR